MAKKTCLAAEIVDLLRQAEVHLSQGVAVVEAVKQRGIREQIYYRWRKEYGGLDKTCKGPIFSSSCWWKNKASWVIFIRRHIT